MKQRDGWDIMLDIGIGLALALIVAGLVLAGLGR
jgi:hypothetical protein